jgi:hypothetical protein
MSESNTIQTQSQIKNQVKSGLKIVEVKKRAYNVIRSIVDSSNRPDYEWNKPIVLNDNKVKFVKYKTLTSGVEVKAWEIVVEPIKIQREGADLSATVISVWDGCNRLVANLIIRTEFTPYEPRKSYTLTITKEPDNIEINADSMHDFEYYIVSPSEPVPYARPVSLAAFVNKLMFFYSKALGVVKDGNAPEDDGI